MAGCLAAVSVAGALCVGAYAADDKPTYDDWVCEDTLKNGSHSRTPDECRLYHSSAGAVVKMSGIMHTVPASSSVTTVHCDTFTMPDYSITNYSAAEKLVNPTMGTTVSYAQVFYTVNVTTNTNGDTVTSYGRIEAY